MFVFLLNYRGFHLMYNLLIDHECIGQDDLCITANVIFKILPVLCAAQLKRFI